MRGFRFLGNERELGDHQVGPGGRCGDEGDLPVRRGLGGDEEPVPLPLAGVLADHLCRAFDRDGPASIEPVPVVEVHEEIARGARGHVDRELEGIPVPRGARLVLPRPAGDAPGVPVGGADDLVVLPRPRDVLVPRLETGGGLHVERGGVERLRVDGDPVRLGRRGEPALQENRVERVGRLEGIRAHVREEAAAELARGVAVLEIRGQVVPAHEQAPLPHPRLEHVAEQAVVVEVGHRLDDRPVVPGRAVEVDGRRALGQLVPLPVAMPFVGELRERRMLGIAEDAQRREPIAPPPRGPVHGGKTGALRVLVLEAVHEEQDVAAFGERCTGLVVEAIGHEHVARIRLVPKGRIDPEVPAVPYVTDAHGEVDGCGLLHCGQRYLDATKTSETTAGHILARKHARPENLSIRHEEAPADLLLRQVLGPIVSDLDLGGEGLVRSPREPIEARQDDGGRVPAADLLHAHDALRLPEGIEDADEGLALPGEVVQHQELVAEQIRRAVEGLVLGLVLHELEAGGGALEVLHLIRHARRGQLVAQANVVMRGERAGELREQHVVVREHRTLSRLVGHDRQVGARGPRGEVPIRVARPDSAHSHVRAVRHPEVVGSDGLASGRGVVDVPRILALRLGEHVVDELPVARHAELVADAEEREGGVVAVGLADAADLGAHPVGDRIVGPDQIRLQTETRRPVVHPERSLRGEVDAEPIRGLERGLRRAPGVEAHVVEAVVADRAEYLEPLFHARRRMARARIDAAVERPA